MRTLNRDDEDSKQGQERHVAREEQEEVGKATAHLNLISHLYFHQIVGDYWNSGKTNKMVW